jgi:hypothetical protein
MENDTDLTQTSEGTVLELLDRVLNQGVVVCGELAISVADIELVYLRLQLALSSVETARQAGWHVSMSARSPRQRQPQPA